MKPVMPAVLALAGLALLAITGKVVSAEHESPAAERKEQATDKAKPPVKKP